MTAAKWASVEAAVAVTFEAASFEETKEGAMLYLEKHCTELLLRAASAAEA